MVNTKEPYCNFCASEELPSGVYGCSDCEPKELKSKIIVGDVVATKQLKPIYLKPNNKLKVTKIKGGMIEVQITRLISKHEVFKIGESQMQYEESNRYKLAQAIKKTGFSAKALSRIVAGNESYFYNKTGVARFNKKGDISDETLNVALTDLAFAEREILGIGAETVEDENHISKETNSLIYRNSWDEDARKRLNNEMIKSLNNQCEERSPNKPLFIGATVVIFIALILFILNNSQVV